MNSMTQKIIGNNISNFSNNFLVEIQQISRKESQLWSFSSLWFQTHHYNTMKHAQKQYKKSIVSESFAGGGLLYHSKTEEGGNSHLRLLSTLND